MSNTRSVEVLSAPAAGAHPTSLEANRAPLTLTLHPFDGEEDSSVLLSSGDVIDLIG